MEREEEKEVEETIKKKIKLDVNNLEHLYLVLKTNPDEPVIFNQ